MIAVLLEPFPVDNEAVLGVENERAATEVGTAGIGHGSRWATGAAVAVWIA